MITIDDLYKQCNDCSVPVEPTMDMIFSENVTIPSISSWLKEYTLSAFETPVNAMACNSNKNYGWVCHNSNCSFKFYITKGKKTKFCWKVHKTTRLLHHALCNSP